MRNLISTRRVSRRIDSSEAPDLPLTATGWDAASDSIICAFGPSSDVPVIEISRITTNGDIESITSWNYHGPCPREGLEVDMVLDLHCFGDDSSICLVLKGGDIVLIREDRPGKQSSVEIVGSVEEGITAASWSPDEGLLGIATAAESFVLMTRQFDLVTSAKLVEDDLKLSKHVNIGWGKKETQFKGKRAAALKDPTMPEKVDEGILSSFDVGNAKLSWRGDAQFVAISMVQGGKRRVIRVFSRSGELDGVSEPVDGMEGTLGWRPSGNLIASTRYIGGGPEVIFFERNGLRHGEFPLRISTGENNKVCDISWNADSTVLAICLRDRIQLWTTMNYYWYLKCEIRSEQLDGASPSASPPHLKWHPEKSLHLYTIVNNCITELNFAWVVHRSAVSPPSDLGIVGVIDGCNLKITPFRFASVPPPMSFRDLALDSSVIDVAISPLGDIIIALTTRQIDLITWDIPRLGHKASMQLDRGIIKFEDSSHCRQVSFFGPDRIAVLHGSHFVDVYRQSDASWVLLDTLQDIRLLDGISNIESSDDKANLLCETVSGNVLTFDRKFEVIETQSFPQPCRISEIYNVANDKRMVVGLAESGRLFADGKLLTNGCTSFVLTESHIIITTTQNLLKFISLVANAEDLQIPSDDAANDERCRSVERGSKLVTAIPSTFAVILQMPRGNLETIYPRALVLAGIRKSIDEKDYKTAFAYCRTHRVDLNILHDHNPEQFMASVDTFLDQVETAQFMDLFLSTLRDENVTKTIYGSASHNSTRPIDLDRHNTSSTVSTITPNKVNLVCDAILAGIKRRPSPSTQNLVTCYVSKQPPDFDSGLLMISEMRTGDPTSADLAIEHICFLADVNKLFDHALGIYDLELALLIAQKSQKARLDIPSPIEYLLELVKYDEEKRRIIVKLHAEHLVLVSNYREAGLSFEQLGLWDQSLTAYQKCGMWQEALYTAGRIPLSSEEITELAGVLAEALIESKDYRNAARVQLDYRDDVKEAVMAFCKGFFFGEAMRVIALRQEFGLLEEVVDAELAESFSTTSELVADFQQQIKSQVFRLKELREKKERDPLSFYGAAGETDVPDNISVAGTDASTAAGSIFTRYTDKTGGTIGTSATRRTSKNRRREERKKARGKKGSVYEEEYLINSIGRLVARFSQTQEESYRLIEGLVRRGMRERAESIQDGIQNVLASLEQVRKDVFGSGPLLEHDQEREDGGVISNPLSAPDFSTLLPYKGLSILKRPESSG
ncbi:hypothetical protein DRE_05070 [Drechslerella stenobrocha 248]|uniref:Elongator complex protein 1 n=1 Tax=Drechslerella stenobrocha 248 TaxID=1043628 RepID=W7I0I3_9PEZI|nr:hypothetical protein DRE_05070 [Drechslerella stenobrocha 248]